jgi:RNAse (barnase) inhibitor barstar
MIHFTKEINHDNELYLYANGKLIYKRWLNHGYSKVFDRAVYGKDTFLSIVEDKNGRIRHRRKIFINGDFCETQSDFWYKYSSQIPNDSAEYFGRNLDAFNDAITSGGPGYPGDSIIEIIGTQKLTRIFGQDNFDFIVELLRKADYVDLIIERVEKY